MLLPSVFKYTLLVSVTNGNAFNNALYSAGVAVTVDGLNPRGMVQSPSKAAGAVEVRMMTMDSGVDMENNITHTEMQICGDLA